MGRFSNPYTIVHSAADAFSPPVLIKPSEGARKILMIRQPGGYSGPWSPEETPYMIEPMDTLASRFHEAVCFVGPSRSGKTMGLLDAWLSHVICHDPGDALVIQMTQDKAREYSKTRIDRAIRYSPELKSRMSSRSADDNTYDKLTKHGMWLKLGWPSITQLSSSDYRYVALTDYDRMPDDIDGEGSGFVLGIKRTQTFLSRGMCMVESSPGKDYEDPHWKPSTPHEAAPVTGVLGIYNLSDRRRWYWKCLDCNEYFEASPGLKLFATLPRESELLEMVRSAPLQDLAKKHASICCPSCGSQIEQKHKSELNNIKTARWVADGQGVTKDGDVYGDYTKSSIAGFWLGGVAAAYQRWDSILLGYLQGLREYALSGSEATLKSKINTDQAMPYISRGLTEEIGTKAEARAEDVERFIVPSWTRFILASVDIQGGHKARFVVQVHAVGVDMESLIIDRYNITKSERGEDLRVDPSSYSEDWDLLTDKVVQSTYRYEGDSELRVLKTIVDYGGEAGVTVQATAWRKRLKKLGLADRVVLGKGDSRLKNMIQWTHARDQHNNKTYQVPILLFSTDKFKDLVSASMRRNEPGPAYMHFPSWLRPWFYEELRAEVRLPDGKWKRIKPRNEALDLWCMIWALSYAIGPGNPSEAFNWMSPPSWAMSILENSELISSSDRRAMKKPVKRIVKKNKPIDGFGSEEWNL
jgi:phage terminase large subunit GpA-like protein